MYNFTLPPPNLERPNMIGSALSAYGGVQQIQGQGMKNALMQEDITQRADTKNALSEYAKSGATDSQGLVNKLLSVNPEMAIKIQATLRSASKDQIEIMKAGADLTKTMAPSIKGNIQGYATNFYPMMTRLGIPVRDPQSFKSPEDYDNYVNTLIAGEQIVTEAMKQPTYSYHNMPQPGGQQQGALISNRGEIKPIPGAVGSTGTPQLFVDPANPNNKTWIAPGQPVPPGMMPVNHGTNLTVDKDGNVTFSQGGAGAGGNAVAPGLGKEGSNKVDVGLLDTTALRAKLSSIERQTNPEFQQYSTKASNWWTNIKSRAGANISEEDTAKATAFAKHKSATFAALADYMKSMSGTAMSEQEATRLKQVMPNTGTGIWDGDSPIQFQAKLDQIVAANNQAIARLNYIKKSGIIIQDPKKAGEIAAKLHGLEEMDGIIQKYKADKQKSYKQQGLSEKDATVKALQDTSNYFGLGN